MDQDYFSVFRPDAFTITALMSSFTGTPLKREAGRSFKI
jgi:hypothetical protein